MPLILHLALQLDESQQAAVAREHQGEMPQAQQPRRGRGLAAAVGVPLHTPGPALSQAHSKGGGVSMHELAQAVEVSGLRAGMQGSNF